MVKTFFAVRVVGLPERGIVAPVRGGVQSGLLPHRSNLCRVRLGRGQNQDRNRRLRLTLIRRAYRVFCRRVWCNFQESICIARRAFASGEWFLIRFFLSACLNP